MVDDFDQIPLADLCTFLNRGTAPSYLERGGMLVLNQKCIRDQRIIIDEARRTDTKRKPISEARMIRRFDVLVNSTGVGTLGRVAQVMELSEAATVDSHITIVRPNPAKVGPRYLGYVLKNAQAEIADLAEGSTGQTELGRGLLGSIMVPLPDISEQRAIGHILGTLDDKIDLNRQMNETLEAMARAIFKSWFVDFDPVRAKAEGRDSGLPSQFADLFPDRFENSETGQIPAGWGVCKLPEVIDLNPSRLLPKGAQAPYLGMANMPTQGARALQVTGRQFGSGMRFANGDTLVAKITPCLENGKTCFVDFLKEGEIGWGSTEYIVFRPRSPLPVEFGYFLARTEDFRAFAISNMTGTSGRQRVPAECFDEYSLSIPPDRIASEFGDLSRTYLKRMKSNDDQSSTLAALRDTLLPKLLSGEIRVKDGEHIVQGTP